MEEEISKGKTAALVAHFTLVGCLIAITMNLEPKNGFARFYIRQTFGLHITFHALVIFLNYTAIPFAWEVLFIIYFGLWVFSFAGVLKNKKSQIPIVGEYFQKWFTFIQ
ncbi:hypothetical protein ACFSQJ_09735 [Croceitalea marina]|uniref:DUF4870 domain-containing protein n=1 Tax=Croceitalea marina TaxID=1775166 RepID=A0ABW5MWQ1_9FLAO